MSVFASRKITLTVSRDKAQTKILLSRKDLSRLDESYGASSSWDGTIPAGPSTETFDLSGAGVGQVEALYLELIGSNVDLAMTDTNGVSTIRLSSATDEAIWFAEGLAVTALTLTNNDAQNTASYYLAVVGDEL